MATIHTYFHAGDVVKLKQNISNKPEMVVLKINKIRPTTEKSEERRPILLGVTCYWFSTTFIYQERTFSSKDLEKIVC